MIKTTSLETSRKLKEAGFKQFGIELCWAEVNQGGKDWKYQVVKNNFQSDNEFIAAPTSDEILEELPYFIEYKSEVNLLTIEKHEESFLIFYGNEKGWHVTEFKEESLPESLASMWLFLKQEGLIE